MARTNDAIEILQHRFGIDPETDPEMLRIAEDFRIGQLIYDARMSAGLTEQRLADAIGTSANVISQLEDANFDGNSLSMLCQIAEALRMEVRLELVPLPTHAE